jgi:3-deoxy-D-manno-octulosonic-acid transferase
MNKGGQNMIEPLQAGAPVLIGPHTGNFEPLATHLCEGGAALRLNSSEEMITAGRMLLADEAKRAEMVAVASQVLQSHQGATPRNCDLVEKLLLDHQP